MSRPQLGAAWDAFISKVNRVIGTNVFTNNPQDFIKQINRELKSSNSYMRNILNNPQKIRLLERDLSRLIWGNIPRGPANAIITAIKNASDAVQGRRVIEPLRHSGEPNTVLPMVRQGRAIKETDVIKKKKEREPSLRETSAVNSLDFQRGPDKVRATVKRALADKDLIQDVIAFRLLTKKLSKEARSYRKGHESRAELEGMINALLKERNKYGPPERNERVAKTPDHVNIRDSAQGYGSIGRDLSVRGQNFMRIRKPFMERKLEQIYIEERKKRIIGRRAPIRSSNLYEYGGTPSSEYQRLARAAINKALTKKPFKGKDKVSYINPPESFRFFEDWRSRFGPIKTNEDYAKVMKAYEKALMLHERKLNKTEDAGSSKNALLPFGKSPYKGKRLDDLPTGYLVYLLRLQDKRNKFPNFYSQLDDHMEEPWRKAQAVRYEEIGDRSSPADQAYFRNEYNPRSRHLPSKKSPTGDIAYERMTSDMPRQSGFAPSDNWTDLLGEASRHQRGHDTRRPKEYDPEGYESQRRAETRWVGGRGSFKSAYAKYRNVLKASRPDLFPNWVPGDERNISYDKTRNDPSFRIRPVSKYWIGKDPETGKTGPIKKDPMAYLKSIFQRKAVAAAQGAAGDWEVEKFMEGEMYIERNPHLFEKDYVKERTRANLGPLTQDAYEGTVVLKAGTKRGRIRPRAGNAEDQAHDDLQATLKQKEKPYITRFEEAQSLEELNVHVTELEEKVGWQAIDVHDKQTPGDTSEDFEPMRHRKAVEKAYNRLIGQGNASP